MKLNKYIWLAALPMLLSACQEDALVDNPQLQNGKFVIKASVDEKGSFSRAQITLEEQGDGRKYGAFQWDEGDTFRMYEIEVDEEWNQSLGATHDFEISGYSNASPSTSATFVSKTTPTDGNRFYAYYPLIETNADGETITMTIDQNLADNSPEAYKAYFNKNMLMLAEGSIRGTETVLRFEHQCGLISVSYTNETSEDKSLKGISMNGDWGVSKTIQLADRWGKEVGTVDSDGYGITFENPVTVAAGETEEFFILFMQPHGLMVDEPKKMNQLSVLNSTGNSVDTLTTDAYTASMPIFYKGSGYRLNVKETADGKLVWTKAPEVKGFRVGTPAELVAALQNKEDSIALSADIVLEAPLGINYGVTLDLAGFNISMAQDKLDDFTTSEDALIVVHRGGHLTLNDISNGSGWIEPGINYPTSTIKMVGKEDEGTELAKLTINEARLAGYNVISGTKGKGNTEIVINGGDINGGWDIDENGKGATGIFHPQDGTLTINGGSIRGCQSAIEMRAGTLIANGGTINSNQNWRTRHEPVYDPNGDGTTMRSCVAIGISQGDDNLPINVTIGENVYFYVSGEDTYAIYEVDLHDNQTDNVKINIAGTESRQLNIPCHIYSENQKGFIGSYTDFDSPTALSYIAAGAKSVHVNCRDAYSGPAAYIPDSEEGNGAEVMVNLNNQTWTIESADADNNYFYIGKNNTLRLTNGIVTVPEDATGLSLIKAKDAELSFMNVTIHSYNVHYAVDVEDGMNTFQTVNVIAGDNCYAFNILTTNLEKESSVVELYNRSNIDGNFKFEIKNLPSLTEYKFPPVLSIQDATIDGSLYVDGDVEINEWYNKWMLYCVHRADNVVLSEESTGWDSVQNPSDENLPALPVYITDPNWIAVIKENYYGTDPYREPQFNVTEEGYIDVNDETNKSIIEGMIRISFSSEEDYSDIKELQHIERFVNLKYLDVLNTSVDSLNLSKNKSLENVYFSGNKLNDLVLDSLQQLTSLTCNDEYLEVMPSVQGCSSLEELWVNLTKLTNLNLTGYQSLKKLHLTDTPIQGTLDLSAVTLLEKLEIWTGTFTSMNLSNNAALKEILLYGEQALTSLDVTGCSNVNNIEFSLGNYDYHLASFNAAGCTFLGRVEIRSTDVPMDVNLDGCTSLTYAWLDNCKSLSLRECRNLKQLWCHQSPELTTLDVSDCISLTLLNCQLTGLTSLDVTGLTLLEDLTCSWCKITEIKGLDSGLNKLERLFCHDNQLNSINVKGLSALQTLETGDNNITELNLSGLINLTSINYLEAPVTTLNVSGCTALETVFLQAGLKHLDITGCTNLSSLQGDSNGEVQMESVKMDTAHDTFFNGNKYLWGEKDSNKYPTPAHKQGYQYPVFTYSTTTAE